MLNSVEIEGEVGVELGFLRCVLYPWDDLVSYSGDLIWQSDENVIFYKKLSGKSFQIRNLFSTSGAKAREKKSWVTLAKYKLWQTAYWLHQLNIT